VDDFGAELGRLQKERGLSLHELARRSYYNVGYLSKVVRGLKGGSRELALRMDKALGADGVLIDAWDRSALPAAPPVPDEPGDNEDVQRRDFLAASAGLAGLLTVPPQLGHLAAGRNIGSEMPDLLRQRLSRLRRLDDYLGGTDTYRVYLAELQATQALAAQAACTGTTRVELVRLISEQAQQAGWAAFDAGWQAAATGSVHGKPR
jgi:transcriptional regulator with XRE-family HTH domain